MPGAYLAFRFGVEKVARRANMDVILVVSESTVDLALKDRAGKLSSHGERGIELPIVPQGGLHLAAGGDRAHLAAGVAVEQADIALHAAGGQRAGGRGFRVYAEGLEGDIPVLVLEFEGRIILDAGLPVQEVSLGGAGGIEAEEGSGFRLGSCAEPRTAVLELVVEELGQPAAVLLRIGALSDGRRQRDRPGEQAAHAEQAAQQSGLFALVAHDQRKRIFQPWEISQPDIRTVDDARPHDRCGLLKDLALKIGHAAGLPGHVLVRLHEIVHRLPHGRGDAAELIRAGHARPAHASQLG